MEKLRQQIEQRLSAVTGDACFLKKLRAKLNQ